MNRIKQLFCSHEWEEWGVIGFFKIKRRWVCKKCDHWYNTDLKNKKEPKKHSIDFWEWFFGH